MGFALFQEGKSKEAVAEFEKALAIDAKHLKAHNNLALAAIDLGEFELAEAHYRESLAIKPDPAIYNDLGFALERMGMQEDAAAAYRKALELDPALSTAHTNLGSSLAQSGNYAEAEKHFRAALKKGPNAQAYAGLGIVLSREGRTDEAIKNLLAAVEADPTNAAAQQELAKLRADSGS